MGRRRWGAKRLPIGGRRGRNGEEATGGAAAEPARVFNYAPGTRGRLLNAGVLALEPSIAGGSGIGRGGRAVGPWPPARDPRRIRFHQVAGPAAGSLPGGEAPGPAGDFDLLSCGASLGAERLGSCCCQRRLDLAHQSVAEMSVCWTGGLVMVHRLASCSHRQYKFLQPPC
jgi:hypothetical protein